MSKLSNTLGIPSMGGGAGSNVMGPLKGMAPGWDGVPTGTPSGIHKAVGDVSSPLGGLQAQGDGTPEWRNAPIDVGQNGIANPDVPQATPTTHSLWGDPDITKRGWGWGMDSKGHLQTGTMGGGPAGTIWGPGGASTPGAPGATPTASPSAMSPQQGMQMAQRMRSMQTPQGGQLSMQQQGPGMGAGSPQGGPGMGGQPGAPGGGFAVPQQFPPQTPGTPAYGQNQQGGIQALIDQLRQQQPQ